MQPTPVLPSAHLLRLPVKPLTRLALAFVFAATASAEIHTWQGPIIGRWSDAHNWSTGQVPNAADDTAFVANTNAAGTDIEIAFSDDTPVTIGRINVSNSSAASSVVIDTTSATADTLTLATTTGQPELSVASGTLRIKGPLAGAQGFIKTGSGTLSFLDNPRPQTFAGVIGLGGGTLEIGADSDLGHADNDLLVGTSATLLANPTSPAIPVVLGAGRGIDLSSRTGFLSLVNGGSANSLEIAGPISGAGSLHFRGPGSLTLAGENTFSGRLIYSAWQPGSGLDRSSSLNFVGLGAVSETGQSLSIGYYINDGPGSIVSPMRIDLGGHARRLHLDWDGLISATVVEFSNGELISDGALAQTPALDISPAINGTDLELRLSAVKTTLNRHTLQIGTKQITSGASTTTRTARVRIGTQAEFNLHQLRIGEGGSSGILDALAPGATLRLRGGNGTNALSSLSIGNFTRADSTKAEALLDLADGVIDAQVTNIYVGNGTPTYPATATLRFGAGTLLANYLTLGSGNSSIAKNFDYRIEQTGGETFLSGALIFRDSNAIGAVYSRYILHGGTLALTQLQATGDFAGTLRPRLEWNGGTLRNYPLLHADFSGPNDLATPFEIILGDGAPKSLFVEDGCVMNIPRSFKLINTSPDVMVAKTGSGTLRLYAQTEDFTGTFRLEAGRLLLRTTPTTGTFHAGAFVWHAGALAFTLNPPPTPSSRIELVGTLTKTSAPASTRVLTLSNNVAAATHTLATYASTDLTLDDFTVAGVPPDTTAEFAIGPSSLSVTIAPETAFTAWRLAKLSSSSNLGPAHDLADPDSDGRPNLLEYALGSEPLAADSAAPVVIARDPAADRLTLTFSRIADPALTYTVRAANDPSGPWSGEGSETVFTSTGADNVAGTATAPDTQPLSLHPRRFLRLFVTR